MNNIKITKTWVSTKLFTAVALGFALASCGSNPTVDMSPAEIGQHLGYSQVVPTESIPAPATFDLEDVNSKTAVLETRFDRNYLILFSHSCPEVAFGGSMKTTATGGRLDTGDSIVIGERYCRISQIYTLQ